jgi:hypothetical protein
LSRFQTASPHLVLRIDPAAAREWLAAARDGSRDAPDSMRALLAGRSRVEVEPAEAERALAWGAQLPGWHEDGRPPLFVHTPGELVLSG